MSDKEESFALPHAFSSKKQSPMKSVFLLPFVLATTLLAEDSVSNAELSRKLDLILGKVSGLEERVAELEKANSEVKKEMQAVQKTATEAKTASQSFALPEDEEEEQQMDGAKSSESFVPLKGVWYFSSPVRMDHMTVSMAPRNQKQEHRTLYLHVRVVRARSARTSLLFFTYS